MKIDEMFDDDYIPANEHLSEIIAEDEDWVITSTPLSAEEEEAMQNHLADFKDATRVENEDGSVTLIRPTNSN